VVVVVVVSYNSADELRACVEPLAHAEDIHVVVVDNASHDGTVERVADLPITVVELPENRGFAAGCNVGWQAHDAPFVLLLNPDAAIEPAAVRRLVHAAERPGVGAVGPKILEPDGSVAPSQRRFQRLTSLFSEAFFLHRVFRRARWSTELVREPAAYEQPTRPDWVSGACMLLRRDVLERLGGLDEGFFMYGEDEDLCKRVWDAGLAVAYEPGAVSVHRGGASAPRTALLPVLATSRIRYACKHERGAGVWLARLAVGLGSITHMVVARHGRAARAGHARALRVAFSPIARDGGRRFVQRIAANEHHG
jgi:N-acetylglucosaminyl-diphospho-decaprenol L-rhamnosyltransferase